MVISMLKSTVSTVKRALSNISPHCHDDVTKILPSNETNKSTDTGGVELSVYPDSESLVAPPKVKDVLVGGKRKRGSKPTRRKKKSKKRNDNVSWWCTDVSYSTGKCGRTKRMLETGGTGGNEE